MPYADPTRKREYQLEWMHARRAEFFAGKSCVHCGATDSLELDHIEPAEKVSHRIWSWSAERRAAEIAKCQVLCTDCHIDKSRAERPQAQHGTATKYSKHGCRCEPCREAQREKMRRYRAKRAA